MTLPPPFPVDLDALRARLAKMAELAGLQRFAIIGRGKSGTTWLARIFRSHPHALHYALKANSTLAIARLLRGLGACADANSGGEIDVALRAGFIPPQIVFTGVGKTDAELAQGAVHGSGQDHLSPRRPHRVGAHGGPPSRTSPDSTSSSRPSRK